MKFRAGRKSLVLRVVAVATVIALANGLVFAWPTPSFIGLGDLPGSSYWSEATGISADGHVVVGRSYSTASGSTTEAFRWSSETGMVGLGDLAGGGFRSEAFAASADGSTIVGFGVSPAGIEAFRWTQTKGMTGLRHLPGGFQDDSEATAVSADGSVVVGESSTVRGPEVFRWTASSGMVGIGQLPGSGPSTQSHAYGVSADGSVIVGWGDSPSGSQAFRWTPDTGFSILGQPPTYSFAFAVSADGAVVAGEHALSAGYEAFRWTEHSGLVDLGDVNPGGYPNSTAAAVNADGSAIVGICSSGACIWDAAHGMRDLAALLMQEFGLDLSGWTLSIATGISADGTVIVGNGINPDGDREAWRAVIPEPATVTLLVMFLPVLKRRRLGGSARLLRREDGA